MTNLSIRISHYTDAKKHLAEVQDADAATFDAALITCRDLRKDIEELAQDEHVADKFDWK